MTVKTLEQRVEARAKIAVEERYVEFRKDIRLALQKLDCAPMSFTEYDPTRSERAKLLLAGLAHEAWQPAIAALLEHEVGRMLEELLDAVKRVDTLLRGVGE